jgi:hypothetical protein
VAPGVEQAVENDRLRPGDAADFDLDPRRH